MMIELAFTALVALLLVGAMQLPALGDALGRFFRGPPPGEERGTPPKRR
jgi:Sec-independent protein translocase protein TatA